MIFPRVLLCGLLCLSPVLSRAAEKSKIPAKPKTVCDDTKGRTIEIVTDRDETVEQFFARQQLSLVDNANTDGKFWSVDQIVKGQATKIFVSYPLQNDQNFRLFRYGDFYHLEKPAPDVTALFADDLALNWKNTMLIVAPSPAAELSLDLSLSDLNRPNARLVGRVFIKDRDKWRPEMEAETLKYQEPTEKTKAD